MRLDQLYKVLEDHFPLAHLSEDLDGEIQIYTGLVYEAPPGYSGGPQNVPPGSRVNVRLREMNAKDLPDAKI
tara:strand:+ start:224 stop:439 length:216 start_codon:yes stop_codon:yes gene_type:complete